MMRKILILFVGVLTIWSCSKDEDNFIEPILHSVKVTTGKDFNEVTFKGIEIVFTNKETQQVFKTRTDEKGEATVSLQPGSYDILANITVEPEEMEKITSQKEEVNFNASKGNVVINKEKNEVTVLTLVAGRVGNLLIKQVYFAGSDTKKGAMFRDQFFEIYNNSNEKLYLDGLCFAQIEGTVSKKTDTKYYYQENGQYDFSKSSGTEGQGEKANKDYVYTNEVIAFPGTGEQYPIEPGKGVIVAGTAVNHKAPLVVEKKEKNGEIKKKEYKILEPELTIDLSGAKFEVFFKDFLEKEGKYSLDTDIDVESAVNMDILYKDGGNRDLILNPQGRDAFVIFRADKNTIAQWRKVSTPNNSAKPSSNKLLQVPKDIIIDGVEFTDVNNKKPKRLPNDIDGGYVKGNKGAFSSESAIRKVAKKIGYRVIYQDTNNSTNDFLILEKPDVSSLN